ncbi:hypothetical protein FD755_013719 [Muntiacus reevesi]|uniref:Uncharacterized protein n=1 Tax=Muntiacus reevesi TaxID=9886 RepID=A0A5N3XMU2_MUNRE|nr:hypothetical protein FD755_013719 [Muntiacus reevesi]
MDEALSAAISYIEDAFFCPICQEVFKTPIKCFLTAMRESRIHCPFCRGNVTRRERVCPEWALDLENIMRKFCGSYRCWGSDKRDTSAADNTESYQENPSSSGHPTFKCPLVQESDMSGETVPGMCPICVSLAWGDPSQITRNFINHLNQRHQFDYGEFYQNAVEESFKMNI